MIPVNKMAYNLFLLPNTTAQYPTWILSLLEEHAERSIVITLDKRYLFSKCPNAVYIERGGDGDGPPVPDDFIIEQIKNGSPTFVLLDDCFFDHSGSGLLQDILNLMKKYKTFDVINVLQMTIAKRITPDARIGMASRVYFPEWETKELEYFSDNNPDVVFWKYAKDELLDKKDISPPTQPRGEAKPIQKNLDIPKESKEFIQNKSSVLSNDKDDSQLDYKTEFYFYKLLRSSLENSMDLNVFSLFLNELLIERIKADTELVTPFDLSNADLYMGFWRKPKSTI